MKYLKLTSEQKRLLDSATETNTTNNILTAIPIEDFYILPVDVKDDPAFAHYSPILAQLETIDVEL